MKKTYAILVYGHDILIMVIYQGANMKMMIFARLVKNR